MSGNYGSTIDIRAARADLVVLLALPRWLCIWRLLIRSFKTRLLRQTWRLPRDCRAGPDWEPLRDYPAFLLYTWRFPVCPIAQPPSVSEQSPLVHRGGALIP